MYVLAAYVIGHVLHQISSPAFPHTIRTEMLLGTKDNTLSPWAKTKVVYLLQSRFGLDIKDAYPPRDVFDLCRAALVQGNAARYIEQFQSLYVTLRHLTTACVLGAYFTIGWLVRSFETHPGFRPLWVRATGIALLGVALTIVFGTAKPKEMWASAQKGASLLVACVGVAAFGFLKAHSTWENPDARWTLSLGVVALFAIHKLLLRSYLLQSNNFSREVFMAFISMATKKDPEKLEPSTPDQVGSV